MDNLYSAIRFLTLIPAGRAPRFDAVGMIRWFPVAGLVVGAILAVFDAAATTIWPAHAVAAVDVLLLALVTGALHLDGLGDTADGLFAHHTRERALAIMKDSRVGAMGLVAVALCLLVKFAGLASITDGRFLALLVIPALARGSMVFAMAALPYGRPEGTGRAFFEKKLDASAYVPLAVCAVPALWLGPRFLLVAIVWAAVTFGAIVFYQRRMGIITGDMLGALCETCEAALFFAVCAGGGA
ncbi:MAG: adenosylcobinamide-GDP ribazoletransferase [Desulfatibacillaceae bacterium]